MPTRLPGFYALEGPFSDLLINELKSFPGPRWDPKRRAWLIPFDLVDTVATWMTRFRLEVTVGDRDLADVTPPFELHPFQREAFDRFFRHNGGILAFEMGLGKTPTGIAIGERVAGTKVVVCPPGIVEVWESQLLKFGLAASVCSTSSAPVDPHAQWVVVASSMTHKMPAVSPAMVIVDEAHNIKNASTAVAKYVRGLRKASPEIPFLAMTGTLAADTLIDVFNPVDLVFPGILGHFLKFRRHYFWLEHKVVGDKEWDEIKGLHPIYGADLKKRLAAIVCQATEAEQAHLLPPKSVERIWVDLPRSESILDRIESPEFHARFLRQHSVRKAEVGAKVAAEESAGAPTALLMYHRDGAEKAKWLLGDGWVLLTGAMSPSQREKAIKKAATGGLSIVATMAAIKEGIDLTPWSRVVVAEFPYYPAMLLQVLKRFHRLNSPGPVKYLMIVGRGSVDETIYAVVEAKLTDAKACLDVGGMADGVLGVAGATGGLASLFAEAEELNDE